MRIFRMRASPCDYVNGYPSPGYPAHNTIVKQFLRNVGHDLFSVIWIRPSSVETLFFVAILIPSLQAVWPVSHPRGSNSSVATRKSRTANAFSLHWLRSSLGTLS